MASFAKISEENAVLQVVVVNDNDILNADRIVDESLGQQYLETHCNWPANLWIQSGHENENGELVRKNHAGIGGSWDAANNMFWPEKPHASWVQHVESASWKSPIGDRPALTAEELSQNSAKTHYWEYKWNEGNQSWDLTNIKA